jgi:hypothetical protein
LNKQDKAFRKILMAISDPQDRNEYMRCYRRIRDLEPEELMRMEISFKRLKEEWNIDNLLDNLLNRKRRK